jgi:hypothetical protein
MGKNKETTIADLATLIKDGFKKSDRRTDEKIDVFALMVQKGFQSMDEKMNRGFDQIGKRIDGVEGRMGNIEKQIDVLQRGQVHIEDRLDEIVPYVKDHEKRITILEKKVALT